MRIVAGKHRGRRLAAPPDAAIRPTSDRAREALFSVLCSGRLSEGEDPVIGARVLDACAGTGALGLEALSRGADHASFLEISAEARLLCRENLTALGEEAHGTVLSADVLRPPTATTACDLILMDPPYGKDLPAPALAALDQAGWIAPGAIAVVELSVKEAFAPPPDFTPLDERRYGKARLLFLRRDS